MPFHAVPVETLPYPHAPTCINRFLHERFNAPTSGRAFVHALTAADLEQCEYHQADWHLIARASVELLKVVGPDVSLAEAGQAAQKVGLPERELAFLVSLFEDPITWRRDAPEVIGQHRVCALHAASVPECVVYLDGS